MNQTTHFSVSKAEVEHFNTQGYVKIKNVFSAEQLSAFEEVLDQIVAQEKEQLPPLEERDTYGKAFIQLGNLWEQEQRIKDFVFSKPLAHIAQQLLEVDSVRMYHDQALYKEADGGITPWHCDQQYWPLESNKTVTAWIPLTEIPIAMGPLEFSAGSQQLLEGRQLEIGDESEEKIGKLLRLTDFEQHVSPYALGEVSFHSGWVFHRAGANTSSMMRKVMTVIYMDGAMKLKQPENKNQERDWHRWCPGAEIGKVIDTPINPILYP
ncbi:MAG: phytanoyl-CoA dioxygenase family protein [Flavobacteriaceae bacterium]|jgi:ectoine hydroxylase-related dioxygenase (phytanoyl-CoA dioxygenase family)